MRGNFQPAAPSDSHAFDTIVQAVDERTAVDSDFGYQDLALVLEPRDTGRLWGRLPTNRFSPFQPQTKPDSVLVLSADQITSAGRVSEQVQTRSQAFAKGFTLARKNRFERLLAELGQELWVGDPAQIKASRVRKQKTDRRDADISLG